MQASSNAQNAACVLSCEQRPLKSMTPTAAEGMDHSGAPCLKADMQDVWARYISKWVASYKAWPAQNIAVLKTRSAAATQA